MREITSHKLPGLNEALEITAIDGPAEGGANRNYRILLAPPGRPVQIAAMLGFQNGPIGEAGFNGISNEALLAVLIDRMRGFQYARLPNGDFDLATPGKYACDDNALTLDFLCGALNALQKRTRARMARGVEGTHNV